MIIKKMALTLFIFAACTDLNAARIMKSISSFLKPPAATPTAVTPATPPNARAVATLTQQQIDHATRASRTHQEAEALVLALQELICMDKEFSIAHRVGANTIEAALRFCEKSICKERIRVSLALVHLFNHQLGLRLFEFPRALSIEEVALLDAIYHKLNVPFTTDIHFINGINAIEPCGFAPIQASFKFHAEKLQTLRGQKQRL